MHLRNLYKGVRPGYHMNKRHWNIVVPDGFILGDMIKALKKLIKKSLKI